MKASGRTRTANLSGSTRPIKYHIYPLGNINLTSLEIDIFHPVSKKWVELGGAGLFRPEVTVPAFGKHVPVLAWGPGFDRIIMEQFNIKDLREMYSNDLKKLREMKFWRK